MFVVFGLAAIAYVSVCLFLYVRQTRMIFLPTTTLETTPQDFGLTYEDIWLPIVSNNLKSRIHGWWIPAEGQANGVILYLHGNGANIGANAEQASRFQKMGFSVLLIDYRGYGQSEGGFPNENKVYEDAEIAWNYLVRDRHIAPEQIVIYGHSLGGAIAIDLAVRHPEANGLIVQSSFTSMQEMVELDPNLRIFPIDWILTQHFNSIHKVPALQMPTLFIHGLADTKIPAFMSERLYAAAHQPKQIWLVPNAEHNNVADTAGIEYFRVVGQFLAQLPTYSRTATERSTEGISVW